MTLPSQDYRLIPLTQGQFAKVDVSDYEWLSEFRWYAHHCPNQDYFYARCGVPWNGRTKQILMHRMILGLTDPRVGIDHINGNTLDNRRLNLRMADKSQNGRNTGKRRTNKSGYKGVSWHSRSKKWIAQIAVNGKFVYLGLHESPELASAAYCEASKRLHGEFGRQ